ncbi:MAG TPA: hypothetical protein VKR61_08360 [Bryobacteraceae bacterium]|nr:hypothetical protein [Bryobacteraceae bacterium]
MLQLQCRLVLQPFLGRNVLLRNTRKTGRPAPLESKAFLAYMAARQNAPLCPFKTRWAILGASQLVCLLVFRTMAAPGLRGATFDELAAQAAAVRLVDRIPEAIGVYKQALDLKPDWAGGIWAPSLTMPTGTRMRSGLLSNSSSWLPIRPDGHFSDCASSKRANTRRRRNICISLGRWATGRYRARGGLHHLTRSTRAALSG